MYILLHMYVWKIVSLCCLDNNIRLTFLLIFSKMLFVFLKCVSAKYVSAIQLNDVEGRLYGETYTYSDKTSHFKIQLQCHIYIYISEVLIFHICFIFIMQNEYDLIFATIFNWSWMLYISNATFFLKSWLILSPKTVSINFLIIKLLLLTIFE